MTRNRRGRFAKRVTVSNVFGLLVATMLIGIPAVKATNAPKQVSIKQGEAVTISCDSSRMEDFPIIVDKKPEQQTVKEADIIKGNVAKIMRHINAYGGKLTQKDIEYAYSKLGYHNTKVLVAISVAETSMGKNARFKNNYWNWGMKSMPSVQAAILGMSGGLNGVYKGIVVNGKVNQQLARCYVSGCKSKGNPPYTWTRTVEWSYSKM